MKRRLLGWTITLPFVFAANAFAQHGHNATPKPPKPPTHTTASHGSASHVTSSHGSTKTTHGSSTHASSSHVSTSHGSSKSMVKTTTKTKTTTTKAAKPTKTTKPVKTTTKAAKPVKTTKTAKAAKPVKTTTASADGSTSKKNGKTTTATTTTTTPGTTPLTPVQQKLKRNTNLAAKLQSRLPVGTDLMTAAKGFRNLGQFVAAVNVSNNQGISFTELKTRMVDQGMSLGQAIQDVKPTTTTNDTTAIARRAQTDADETIRSSEGTTTTTKTKYKAKPGERR